MDEAHGTRPQTVKLDPRLNREKGDQFGKKDPSIYRCLKCHALLFEREIEDHRCYVRTIYEIAARKIPVAAYPNYRYRAR